MFAIMDFLKNVTSARQLLNTFLNSGLLSITLVTVRMSKSKTRHVKSITKSYSYSHIFSIIGDDCNGVVLNLLLTIYSRCLPIFTLVWEIGRRTGISTRSTNLKSEFTYWTLNENAINKGFKDLKYFWINWKFYNLFYSKNFVKPVNGAWSMKK